MLGLVAFYGLIKSPRARREYCLLFPASSFSLPDTRPHRLDLPLCGSTQHHVSGSCGTTRNFAFTLWGVIIVFPLVLGYTVYSYTVFSGKWGKRGIIEFGIRSLEFKVYSSRFKVCSNLKLDFDGIQCHNLFVCSTRKLHFAFILLLLLTIPSHAEINLKIPVDYGEAIYRFNGKSPNQIFIIGISHRDSLTCPNGEKTSRVQAEDYQIGDWLIHHQGLQFPCRRLFFNQGSKDWKRNYQNPGKEGLSVRNYRIISC